MGISNIRRILTKRRRVLFSFFVGILCLTGADRFLQRREAMKKGFQIVLFLLLAAAGAMGAATDVAAQTVQDAGYKVVAHIKADGTLQDDSYRVIGHIKADGTIQDSSYRVVGHLKSDGTVQDASYRVVGHIKSDGTVQDSSYRVIGHIKEDGTVQDASYRVIGHTKGVSREWAALYFFFR